MAAFIAWKITVSKAISKELRLRLRKSTNQYLPCTQNPVTIYALPTMPAEKRIQQR